MRTDFGELAIEQAIVHSVPSRARNDPREYTVELSDESSKLSSKVQSALERRLVKILNSHACSVTEDLEPKSPLPDWVRDFMDNDLDLVEVSGHLARHLQDCQTAANSRGLLMVAEVRLARERGLLLVKLEQETGMQARRVGEDGKRTFDVHYYADLLFTEKASVFKLALFTADAVKDDLLEGWAADRQRSDRRMAGFFLHNYLGCRFTEDPAEVTSRFHEVALKWVNTRLSDPADAHTRVDYTLAVLSELKSAPENLNPREFAARNLKGTHRQEFLTHLAQNGISDRTFVKDTTLIDARLQKMQVNFASGAFLVAPLDAVDQTVTFEALEDGGTKATVVGEVTAARGFAPPGGRPKKTTSAVPDGQPREAHDEEDGRDTVGQ
ncbi:nucleoid-associated protein [Streptomyces sp. NPDC001975]